MNQPEFFQPEVFQTKLGPVIIRLPMASDQENIISLRKEALTLFPQFFGSSADQAHEIFQQWADHWIETTPDWFFPLVCECDGKLVGMAAIRRENSPKRAHYGTIIAVYLQQFWKGQGIMQRMFQRFDQWAIYQGLHHIKLSVTTSNLPAVRMYLKAGFKFYATDLFALKVDGVFYDNYQMIKIIDG